MEKFDIARLKEILSQYGAEWETWEDQKTGSYEHALAGSSLEHLEHFYSVLFTPGKTDEEKIIDCPPWPSGTARAGQQPSAGLLSKIATRIRTESTLNSVGRMSQFIERVGEKCKQLPGAQQSKVLDGFVTVLQEEMVTENLSGVPMAAMLKPLDRLLTKEQMDRESNTQAEKKRQKEKDQQLKQQQIAQSDRRIALLESKVKAASDEVKKLREPGSQLSDDERKAIVAKVDEILGLKS
jgi:hypothetical protein